MQLFHFPENTNWHLLCEFTNSFDDKLPAQIYFKSENKFGLLNEIVERFERALQTYSIKTLALAKENYSGNGIQYQRGIILQI